MTKEEFVEIRKTLNLTQTALGAQLGKTLRQVQYYENSKKIPESTVRMMKMLLREKQMSGIINNI